MPRWVRPVFLVAAAVALFAVIFLVTGCAGTVTTVLALPSPSEQGNREAVRALGSQHCGLERWPVKVGTDADAALVDLDLTHATPVTIAQLTAQPPPPLPLPQASRLRPAEVTVYQVTATLTQYRIEADGDVHAVLADDHGNTMIAEFPDPACAQGSRFLPQIAAARGAFDAQFHPTDVWQTANARITVTGVGFYDLEHGQTGGGVLAGGQVTIELHPVLGMGG